MKKEELKKELTYILNDGIEHNGKTYQLNETQKNTYIQYIIQDVLYMYKISNIKWCHAYFNDVELEKESNILCFQLNISLYFKDGLNHSTYSEGFCISIEN